MSMLANELGWDRHRSEQVLVSSVRFSCRSGYPRFRCSAFVPLCIHSCAITTLVYSVIVLGIVDYDS